MDEAETGYPLIHTADGEVTNLTIEPPLPPTKGAITRSVCYRATLSPSVTNTRARIERGLIMGQTKTDTHTYSEMDIVALADEYMDQAPLISHALLMSIIRLHCEECIIRIELPFDRMTGLPRVIGAASQHELNCSHG
jgi:hypothetical protein